MKLSSAGVLGIFTTATLTLAIPLSAVAQFYPGGGGFGGGGYGSWQTSQFCTGQTPTLPVCNLPGNMGGTIGGGYGGQSGQPLPADVNGRPDLLVSRNLSSDYDCPLFENRPYDGLTQAMDSLTASMNTTPECGTSKPQIDTIATNVAALRDSATSLQQVMLSSQSPVPSGQGYPQPLSNPNVPGGPFIPDPAQNSVSMSSNDPVMIQRNITNAITAASNIGQLFGNNTFINSSCGKGVTTGGKALIAINDIMNNLAPFALMATAFVPGLGLAAKFAITGGAIATSAISSIVQMIQQGTVDMNNPDHRKALLKNTCQYTKIGRKVRFLKLAQSGQLTQLNQELKADTFPKKPDPNATSPIISDGGFTPINGTSVQSALATKEAVERNMGILEQQMSRDNFELAAAEEQLKESTNDDVLTCLYVADMAKSSNRNDQLVFPATIMATLGIAIQAQNIDEANSPALQAVYMRNDLSRKRLLALQPLVAADNPPPDSAKLCAQTAQTWIATMREALTDAKQIVNEQRSGLLADLQKNPDYVQWQANYNAAQLTQLNISRAAGVMKQMASDDSALDRSELDQRMAVLKGALFGVNVKVKLGHSPVQEWILHTMQLHDNRLSSLIANIKTLQQSSYEMTPTGKTAKTGGWFNAGSATAQTDRINGDYIVMINKSTTKPGTRGFDIVCQQMETAWLDWAAASDHVKAVQFMCDMIDPYLDDTVESNIISICRGNIAPDNRVITKSQLQATIDKANNDLAVSGDTLKKWATRISQKLHEIKCPTPAVTALN